MRRSLWGALGAGVVLASVTVGVATAQASPECPRGNVAVGVACHENDPGKDNWTYDPATGSYRRTAPAPVYRYDPATGGYQAGAPRTQRERLVMVRACIDLRVGRLAGLDTGNGPLAQHRDAVAIELSCNQSVPPCPPPTACPCPAPVTPPAEVVPPAPPTEVAPPEQSAPVDTVPAPQPPTAAENLPAGSMTPVAVTH